MVNSEELIGTTISGAVYETSHKPVSLYPFSKRVMFELRSIMLWLTVRN